MKRDRMYRVSDDYKQGYNALDDLKTVGKALKRLVKGQTEEEAEEEERQKNATKRKAAQEKMSKKYGNDYKSSQDIYAKYDSGDKVTLKKKSGDTVEGEVTDAWFDNDLNTVMYEVVYDGDKTVNVPEKAIVDSRMRSLSRRTYQRRVFDSRFGRLG